MPIKKRGRPVKYTGKRHKVTIRMSEEMYNMLMYICIQEDKTITDVVVKGIRMVYNLTKNGIKL